MDPRLRLLGGVTWNGVSITGKRIRSLLHALAEAGPRGLSTAGLIEVIWADSSPAHPPKAVQILVSRARSQTAAEALARTESGYRLDLPAEDVEAWALASALADAEEALAKGAIDQALESAGTRNLPQRLDDADGHG